MQSLEEHLDPNQFFRIHRSTIVQLDRIETLLVGAGADYTACLKNGQRLKISRKRWEALLQRLMIESPSK
jgi:two-component system LytT family response regulator